MIRNLLNDKKNTVLNQVTACHIHQQTMDHLNDMLMRKTKQAQRNHAIEDPFHTLDLFSASFNEADPQLLPREPAVCFLP